MKREFKDLVRFELYKKGYAKHITFVASGRVVHLTARTSPMRFLRPATYSKLSLRASRVEFDILVA